MEDPKIKLLVFGPFDRFNYGDLLFPLIIRYAFRRIHPDKYLFEFYGLVHSDLTSRGGLPTKSYRDLKKDIRKVGDGNIIVAGGEILNATWHVMRTHTDPFYHLMSQIKGVRRLLKTFKVAQKKLGGKSEYPFCINKSAFGDKINVVYNAVGGTHISSNVNASPLKEADYLGIRDMVTSGKLMALGINSLNVIPDCATILSDLMDDAYFAESDHIRSEIRNLEVSNYIVFQISDRFAEGNSSLITKQLKSIMVNYRLKLVLLPFATLPGHTNNKPLRAIHTEIPGSIYLEQLSVDEISFLIKNAACFIGSSLHGAIVSMSYSIKYIALGGDNIKVDAYLKTWAIDGLDEVVGIERIFEKFEQIWGIDFSHRLYDRMIVLKEKYYTAIGEMHKLFIEKYSKK